MQKRRFRNNAIHLLWFLVVLPACSMTAGSSPPPISSTRGMTLVRMGTVIETRALSPAAPANGAQQVMVQFDDGQTARYEVTTHPPLQSGERVTVSDHLGKVRIFR